MNVRKSPVRHRVRAHSRRGLRGSYGVRSYVRGKGEKAPIVHKRKLSKAGKGGVKPYTVNFTYSNNPKQGETVVVIAPNYKAALDEAFEERKSNREPIAVEVIDPDWGKVFKAVGRGAKRVGELGGKFARKTYAKVAPWIKKKWKEHTIRDLIIKAYSRNRVERTMARYRLKSEYPEVYNICSFSRR